MFGISEILMKKVQKTDLRSMHYALFPIIKQKQFCITNLNYAKHFAIKNKKTNENTKKIGESIKRIRMLKSVHASTMLIYISLVQSVTAVAAPVYPSLHVHMKLPSLFSHLPFVGSHIATPVVHSLISA